MTEIPATGKPVGTPVWLELASADQPAAVAFYGGVLGWSASEPFAEFGGYQDFSVDGATVAGVQSLEPGELGSWTTLFRVDDIAAAVARGRALGATEISDPEPAGELGVAAYLTDPTGARFALWQVGEFAGIELEDEPGAPCWYELHTKDFATASAFYAELFGWRLDSTGDSDEFRMATAGDPGDPDVGIYDAARSDESEESVWMPYFAVADADRAAALVREHGGAMLDEPTDTPYGRMAHAVDPGGALFTIITLPHA